jgi:hypothetical protein
MPNTLRLLLTCFICFSHEGSRCIKCMHSAQAETHEERGDCSWNVGIQHFVQGKGGYDHWMK